MATSKREYVGDHWAAVCQYGTLRVSGCMCGDGGTVSNINADERHVQRVVGSSGAHSPENASQLWM